MAHVRKKIIENKSSSKCYITALFRRATNLPRFVVVASLLLPPLVRSVPWLQISLWQTTHSPFDHPHLSDLCVFFLVNKKLRKSYASGNFDSLARSLSQITSHSVFEESILSCAAHVFSAAVSHFSWKQTFLSPSHFAKNPPHYVQLCLLGDVMELLKAKELITSYDKHFNKK